MEEIRERPKAKVVAIFGKAENEPGDIDPKIAEIANSLGKLLAERKEINVIVTGGATGYPQIIAESIRAQNPDKEIFAFSPTDKPDEFHREKLVGEKTVENGFTVLAIPSEVSQDELEALKSRSKDLLLFTKNNSGVAIVIGGGIGTKHETLNALNMEIPVFVLAGSGGFADEIRNTPDIRPDKRNLIHYANQPEDLVEQIVKNIK